MQAADISQSELVVEEGVSRFGLHRIHVIRWGGPVSEEHVERLNTLENNSGAGVEGRKLEAVVRYKEESIDLYHLRIYWREIEKGAEA